MIKEIVSFFFNKSIRLTSYDSLLYFFSNLFDRISEISRLRTSRNCLLARISELLPSSSSLLPSLLSLEWNCRLIRSALISPFTEGCNLRVAVTRYLPSRYTMIHFKDRINKEWRKRSGSHYTPPYWVSPVFPYAEWLSGFCDTWSTLCSLGFTRWYVKSWGFWIISNCMSVLRFSRHDLTKELLSTIRCVSTWDVNRCETETQGATLTPQGNGALLLVLWLLRMGQKL